MLKDWAKKTNIKAEKVNYIAEFTVDSNFGEPGAITVINNHQQEFFLENITIEGFATGAVYFPCNSWVQARKDLPGKRIFFSNKVLIIDYFFNYFFVFLLFHFLFFFLSYNILS